MTNPRRTYFLAPTLDSPPNGPIVLGNIITDPKEPDFCLNSRAPASVRVHVSYRRNQVDDTSRDRQASGGIIASFLSSIGLGANLTAGRGHAATQMFNIPLMETQRITPDAEYIRRAIRDRRVQEHLTRARFFRKHVYMITGIIIARGASAVVKDMKSHKFQGHIAVNLAATGAPIEVGPTGSYATSRGRHESFDIASDFVLAYSLRKISYDSDGRVRDRSYHKGAYMENASGSTQEDDATIDDGRLVCTDADSATFDNADVVPDNDGEEEIECVVLQ